MVRRQDLLLQATYLQSADVYLSQYVSPGTSDTCHAWSPWLVLNGPWLLLDGLLRVSGLPYWDLGLLFWEAKMVTGEILYLPKSR